MCVPLVSPQAFRREQLRLVATHRDWVALVVNVVESLGGKLPCGHADTAVATLRQLAQSPLLSADDVLETFAYLRRWVLDLPPPPRTKNGGNEVDGEDEEEDDDDDDEGEPPMLVSSY